MAYEALYRRYRPSRFKDAFFGQDHVVAALRNAIEGDRVGHAYLFSGPRGTGKTTSARILAKALNCTNLQDGEPCNECDSCLEFQSSGGSYNLHELDAASNNGVDAMRDLIGKVALGSPGRTKVYILDEVHMLSSGAENALLKTLEEPPPHVVFVLCTTEPNKVVPTIRSRTQHLEFSLLSAAQVGELIDYVVGDAGLEITAEDRAYVVRAGGGSARDTLSALDQVVAAGGAPQGGEHLEALFQSLIDRDAAAALAAIDGAMQAGRDPGQIGTALLHELRTVFLATMRADLGHLSEAEADRANERAASMPPARVTRAVEVIGAALIEMRQAPDPRVDLEVAVMRLTRADLDTDPAALLERVEALEAHLAGGAPIQPPVTGGGGAGAGVSSPAAPAEAAAPQEAAVSQQQPPSTQHAAPAPPHPPQQQPAPNAAPARPAATPPQASPAPQKSAGRRGADIARAELARQGIVTSPKGGSPTPQPSPEPAAQSPAAQPPAAQSAQTPPSAAPGPGPASTGKTLADIQRERQAAAQAAAGGAPATDPQVEAAAAARRERQAAAQAAGSAVPEPAEDPSPPGPATEPAAAEESHQSAPATEPEPAPDARAAAAPEHAGVPAAETPDTATSSEPPAAPPAAAAAPAAGGTLPSKAELEAAWSAVLESTSGRVRSRFSAGHFVAVDGDTVQFGLPNPVHRDRCEEVRAEVDAQLANQFGRPIPLTLVVDMVEPEPDFFTPPPSGGSGPVEADDDPGYEDEHVDVHDLVDATGDIPSAADRVMATFENSVLIEDPPNPHPNQ